MSFATTAACGVDDSLQDPRHGRSEDAGSVGLELKLGDVIVNSLDYVITGNGFVKDGTINVAKSKTISAIIGGIPAGSGYNLTLTGADATDPFVVCSASATFNITARSTTVTIVRLDCRLPSKNGSVKVEGSANVCPRIDAMSVEPSEVVVGGSIALSASITDSDASPAAATYAWSASGGSLTGASSAAASFECTAPGSFDVTLLVSDTQCSEAVTATVTCSPDDTIPAPRPNVKVNEVESNQGTPGDWTELYNADSVAADISGWVFKDNDDMHVYTFPAGTIIPAGGYFVVEEAAQTFGLGSADSARLFDATGELVDSYSWTAHAATTYGRCPNGTGAFTTTASSTQGAANACPVPVIKINEIESSGGVPGDWTELVNVGSVAGDISGWVFKDNDDSHAYTLPAGTILAPGAYFVVEEAAQGFGLGAADSARLFDATGALVDSHAWTAHAAVTYGRCPDGTGAFANQAPSTKGAVNSCAPTGPVVFAWPGQNDVTTQDVQAQYTSNLSGLTYTGASAGSPAVLWAVVNGPGTLYRLIDNGTNFVPDTAGDWSLGKALRYPDGTGNPDSEGVTFAASLSDGIYVATERNNDASTVSRSALLRFDVAAPGPTLTATHDFNLTSLLPVVGANLGIEAVTWVPDSYLTAKDFFDQAAGHTYVPSEYPDHGSGLFFVGVEGNGSIYAFALNHASGVASLIATIVSGQTGVMGLEFDRETSYLWFTCDDTCGSKSAILEIDTTPGSPTLGRFLVRRLFDRPSSLPNTNNEGFAIAPEAECVGGFKPAFWSDDNDLDGFSLRRDSVPCAAFLP
ncbi:MAG TPA: lamin tail domain-containing protein [Polyangiaceae bacterium]|nr:lamin tail domain-containing protein [Polyangiaceae bacterium]